MGGTACQSFGNRFLICALVVVGRRVNAFQPHLGPVRPIRRRGFREDDLAVLKSAMNDVHVCFSTFLQPEGLGAFSRGQRPRTLNGPVLDRQAGYT